MTASPSITNLVAFFSADSTIQGWRFDQVNPPREQPLVTGPHFGAQ
jgi:hypothetical protein